MRDRRIFKSATILLLTGASLVCLVFIAPDAAGQAVTAGFIKVALSGTWGKLMEFPVAWCSFKMVLLCLGMFLVIESAGTILSVANFRTIALLTYCLHVLPCFGVLTGVYCLFKSLL